MKPRDNTHNCQLGTKKSDEAVTITLKDKFVEFVRENKTNKKYISHCTVK